MRTSKTLVATLTAAACCIGPALTPQTALAGQPTPAISAAQQGYLALAQAGVAQAHRHWWDQRCG
jgi:hypothetical protein